MNVPFQQHRRLSRHTADGGLYGQRPANDLGSRLEKMNHLLSPRMTEKGRLALALVLALPLPLLTQMQTQWKPQMQMYRIGFQERTLIDWTPGAAMLDALRGIGWVL